MRYRGMVIATNDHITTNAVTAAMRFQRLSLAMLLSFELRFLTADSVYAIKLRCSQTINLVMGRQPSLAGAGLRLSHSQVAANPSRVVRQWILEKLHQPRRI